MKYPRLLGWWILTILLIALLAGLAPARIGDLAYKVTLVTFAATLGFYLDRSLLNPMYERMRCDSLDKGRLDAARVLGRAIVVSAVVIGLTMAL